MQTQPGIIGNNSKVIHNISSGGGIGHWVTRLFGCWHKEMSRPFSSQGQTYRTCLDCGARRQFNLGRWEMQGDFYYRPLSGLAAWRPGEDRGRRQEAR